MSDYGKDALKRLLLRIDEEAYLELGILSPRPKIVIAGGSALLFIRLNCAHGDPRCRLPFGR